MGLDGFLEQRIECDHLEATFVVSVLLADGPGQPVPDHLGQLIWIGDRVAQVAQRLEDGLEVADRNLVGQQVADHLGDPFGALAEHALRRADQIVLAVSGRGIVDTGAVDRFARSLFGRLLGPLRLVGIGFRRALGGRGRLRRGCVARRRRRLAIDWLVARLFDQVAIDRRLVERFQVAETAGAHDSAVDRANDACTEVRQQTGCIVRIIALARELTVANHWLTGLRHGCRRAARERTRRARVRIDAERIGQDVLDVDPIIPSVVMRLE